MKKKLGVFDIAKANMLLASTLGIVLGSCRNNDKDQEEGTPSQSNKFDKINEQLGQLGVTKKITDDNGLKELATKLGLSDNPTEKKVLEKLEEISKTENKEKDENKKILDLLKESKSNDEKDDFANANFETLLTKLTDDNNNEIDPYIKKLAEGLLKQIAEIKKTAEDKNFKDECDTILKSLRAKTGLVLKKDSNKKDIDDVKQQLEKLNELITPKNTGDQEVIKLVDSIIVKLFKDKDETKDLTKDDVYKNIFEITIDEKGGKLSLSINFKNTNLGKKLIIKEGDCKKLFSTDGKTKENFTESIAEEDIPNTPLYRLLTLCIDSILKVMNIADNELKINDSFSLNSANSNLLDVNDYFEKMITPALSALFSEIKFDNSIKADGDFYKALGSTYLTLLKNEVKSLESDECFIDNTENAVSGWLLKNIGIVEDNGNFVMFKGIGATNDGKIQLVDKDLKSAIDTIYKKLSFKSILVQDVWANILDGVSAFINNQKTVVKVNIPADGIYTMIKDTFKKKNKNSDDPIFKLKKFDDTNWGNDIFKDPNAIPDNATFDKSGTWNADQDNIIRKVLTQQLTDKILSHVNEYKCISGKEVTTQDYNNLIAAVNKFLGFEIIKNSSCVLPFVEIKTPGQEIKEVKAYLKAMNVTDYDKVKNQITNNSIKGGAQAFKLGEIIEKALENVQPNKRVYVMNNGEQDITKGLKFDQGKITLDGTGDINDLLLSQGSWLDTLAIIFKGNTDIYANGKVRADAFNGIFANNVDCANVLVINDTTNNPAAKKVIISTTGKVEITDK